ncbi:hypothetical protein POV27_05485 [Aureisphaera galaxeae]|uniref:hypothetical protein n=1 Tax=Aureisphaera galaxeae TaxID=1538023 RepID=UPI002350FAA6|nr:hypothetical protein [Aureisphaera galaxeae]MDC8003493.1 hypothetical protein [Aureisphaera galaxeae]
MLVKVLKLFLHIVLILLLTAITQVGGLLYLCCLLIFRKKGKYKYLYFAGIYLFFTFLVVPWLAPLNGRERIENSDTIRPCNYFYVLANRNYVSPQMNETLQTVSHQLNLTYPGLELVYLDANFPFFDGFPLPPHLSHSDGKKIDINFIYQKEGTLSNKKPSLSGYGVYEAPKSNEWDQPSHCEEKGHWQYSFPQFLTFGTWNEELQFADAATKDLLNTMLRHPNTQKVFIEPHLKQRLRLEHKRLRYHGCQAVRHDDHIHLQVH